MSFKKFENLKNHKVKFHSNKGKPVSRSTTSQRRHQPCIISSCSIVFQTTNQLIEHAVNVHDANIKIENVEFDTVNQFSDFRSNEDFSSNTRFVRKSRQQVNKKGDKVYSLVCQRNGLVESHRGKGVDTKPNRKHKKGHCQTNSLCLARFSLCEHPDGNVSVKYVKSHKHSLSFKQSTYLPIPDSLKSEIVNMVALKIPFICIIDKVRDHFSDRENMDNLDDLKYYHLIDRKTIHSLKTKVTDPTIRQDNNDALSTSKVDALRQESFDPVFLFKQQGTEDPTHGISNENVFLAIMTKEQLDIYKKFAGRILCMDSTHNTNIYSFKLITLMVPDEFRKGYPVEFCI